MNSTVPITVALFGGLGNQMFQYAFALSLSVKRAVPFTLDRRSLLLAGHRPYAMDGMALPYDELSHPTTPVPNWLWRRLRWPPRFHGVHYFMETGGFNNSSLDVPLPAYFWGAWQDQRYFVNVASLLRDSFALQLPMSAERQDIAKRIREEASVAIHVRRGDYASNPKATAFHGLLSSSWYAQAIRYMEVEVPGPLRFFVFSDDVDWARANLELKDNATFVRPGIDGRDCEDLHLMSLCDHQIIANSSFSWWAAWLNDKANKKVIAPVSWFQDKRADASHIVPDSWIRL